MGINQVNRLPGTRDIKENLYASLNEPMKSFNDYLLGKQYHLISTPILEKTELFVRKSGGELTGQLYSFVDPGGNRVSLRPEFTSSVIRHFIQDGQSLELPIRWQYSGPVFRYNGENDQPYTQFTQIGAELIGKGDIEADAEILCTAWESLRKTGLSEFEMRIGHLGVLQDVLNSFDLSNPTKLFIIGNLRQLSEKNTTSDILFQNAENLGLIKNDNKTSISKSSALKGSSTRELLGNFLSQSISGPMGRRTPDQIVDRLLRKVTDIDSPDKLTSALNIVNKLVSVKDDPESALNQLQDISQSNSLDIPSLNQLNHLFETLSRNGIKNSNITLDLGLARGISYYTGVIFEFFSISTSKKKLLGGGGRYDDLIKALGGPNIPASGFAFNLDQIVNILNKS